MAAEDLTILLERASDGDREAEGVLWERVYADLKRIAHSRLRDGWGASGRRAGGSGDTLQTTALVHEAYLRLFGATGTDYQNRVHFFATASKVMRNILINYVRAQRADKRGGGIPNLSLNEQELGINRAVDEHGKHDNAETLMDLDDALTRLAGMNPRMVDVVECKFFGGMTTEETASALGVSDRTVRRDWRLARAWLTKELGP